MNAKASPSVSVPAASRCASGSFDSGRIKYPARRPPQYAGDNKKTRTKELYSMNLCHEPSSRTFVEPENLR